MGVGNLHIGENLGGAQVFSHNPAIQQFADILAQRKAKRDSDNKFLNDQLATTYDPGVLRNDVDKSTYIDKYNKVKSTAIDAENEKNDKLRAMKISQVRQQLGDLHAWGEGSKKQALIDRQLGMEFMKNADHYEDNSVDKYKKGLQLNWDHPDVINNPSQIERRSDPVKMETEYQKANADILKHHPATYDSGTIQYGPRVFGRKTATLTQNRVVPYQDALEYHLHRATADPNYQKYLRDKYPDIKADNPSHQLALRVAKDMQDHGDDRGLYDKPKTKEYQQPQEDKFYQHQQWLLNHGLKSTTNERTPAQINIAGDRDPISGQKTKPGVVDNDPEQIQKFISLIPQGQYGGKFDPSKVVQIDPNTGVQTWTFPEHVERDAKNAALIEKRKAQYEANPEKEHGIGGLIQWGKPIPWEQSDSYKDLVKQGVQEYKPVKNQPRNTYTIDPNSPNATSEIAKMGVEQKVNFKQLNDIEGRKSGHGQIKEAQAKVKSGGKTVSADKIKTLVGKPGYEGYTEQELINYYKKQGYNIK